MSIVPSFTNFIGYFAACCTTLSFLPQLAKIRKQGGAGLSYAMLSIYLAGLLMWLIYGILLKATAVVVANAASAALVAIAIAMKAMIRSQSTGESSEELPKIAIRGEVTTSS
jgi:MtN3 and saliva related transmembrane protein